MQWCYLHIFNVAINGLVKKFGDNKSTTIYMLLRKKCEWILFDNHNTCVYLCIPWKFKKSVISNELHNIKVKYHINKYFNAQKSSL